MSRWAIAAAGLSAAALAACGGGGDASTPQRAAAARPAAAAPAPCATGGTGATEVVRSRDAVLGPLVLIGGRAHARRGRDAFERRGYKIPATLAAGATATLSVPRRLRGSVGLVFSLEAQDRVMQRGVRGADGAVRFEACPATGKAARTGWPGGLVTTRRRCAALVLTEPGRPPVRRRVPLGRPCRAAP